MEWPLEQRAWHLTLAESTLKIPQAPLAVAFLEKDSVLRLDDHCASLLLDL